MRNRLKKSFSIKRPNLLQEQLERRIMAGQEFGTLHQQENFSIKRKSEQNLVIVVFTYLDSVEMAEWFQIPTVYPRPSPLFRGFYDVMQSQKFVIFLCLTLCVSTLGALFVNNKIVLQPVSRTCGKTPVGLGFQDISS